MDYRYFGQSCLFFLQFLLEGLYSLLKTESALKGITVLLHSLVNILLRLKILCPAHQMFLQKSILLFDFPQGLCVPLLDHFQPVTQRGNLIVLLCQLALLFKLKILPLSVESQVVNLDFFSQSFLLFSLFDQFFP